MTTPTSGAISLADVRTETGGSGQISMDDTSVRRLGEDFSGEFTMGQFYNRTWLKNFTGVQSSASCYSAQGGFSVDRHSDGKLYLNMGVWPTDPPNCQTCDWHWLSNNFATNNTRKTNNTRPYWTQTWQICVTDMSVGSTVDTRAPNWPYTLVSYTYRVTRTGTNSVKIVPYPNSWGTGDTGTSISVGNWWNNVVTLGGGDPNSGTLGSINLSWTDIGY